MRELEVAPVVGALMPVRMALVLGLMLTGIAAWRARSLPRRLAAVLTFPTFAVAFLTARVVARRGRH